MFYVPHDCEWRRQYEELTRSVNSMLLALTEVHGEIRIPDNAAVRASESRIEQFYDPEQHVTVWKLKEPVRASRKGAE